MTETSHPLTDEHLAMLKDAKNAVAQARLQIDRAQRAGIDVAAHRQQLADVESQVNRILNAYFPGRA